MRLDRPTVEEVTRDPKELGEKGGRMKVRPGLWWSLSGPNDWNSLFTEDPKKLRKPRKLRNWRTGRNKQQLKAQHSDSPTAG